MDLTRGGRGRLLVLSLLAAVAAVATALTLLSGGSASPRATAVPTLTSASPAAPLATSSPTPASPSPARDPRTGPVPSGFRSVDLSFVSADRGWALGTAACGTPPCTSLLSTVDGGRHWAGGAAPVLPLVGEPGCTAEQACLRTLRFADAQHGYAFGGALVTTDDGGTTWTRQTSPYVDALEAGDGTVLRVVHRTEGCPPGCVYTLERAPVGSRTWTPVNAPTIEGNRPLLLRQGSAAYLLVLKNPAGGAGDAHPQLLVSRDSGTTWAERPEPCGPSAPNSPDERDASAAAVAPDGSFTVLCTQRSTQRGSVLVSTDQARTFSAAAALPTADRGVDVAASSGSRLVVAAIRGGTYELLLSTDGGATWGAATSAAQPTPGAVTGAVTGDPPFLGFTTALVGTAAQPTGTSLWRTADGGRTWSPQPWRSPA